MEGFSRQSGAGGWPTIARPTFMGGCARRPHAARSFMDQAVSPVPLDPVVPPSTFTGKLAALPQAQKMKLGIAVAAVLAVMVAIAMWANRGDWKVLYANLPDKDLAYLNEGTQHYDDYVQAVGWAQKFARMNREVMMQNLIAAVRKVIVVPDRL
eukprot:gene3373-4438_t